MASGQRLSGLQVLYICVFVALFLWLGGFLHFVAELPRRQAQQPGINDAIVVLTGGRGRLQVGLRMLAAGRGARLLISGVKSGISAVELRDIRAEAAEMFSCCVDLGYQAHDTRGNAIEASLWARHHGYRSLHLVTASYHMPRSLLLFRQAMSDVDFQPIPVMPVSVKLDQWWLFPGTLKLLIVEYSKFLVSLIRVRLTSPAI